MNADLSQPQPPATPSPRATGLCTIFLVALLCSFVPSAQSREPIDWRWNGAGSFPSKAAHQSWTETQNIAWQKSLPEPSNATPMILKDRVIVMMEPTTVMALKRSNGAKLWSRSISIFDTYAGAERQDVERRARAAQQAYASQEENKRALYRLKRMERRGRLSEDQRAKLSTMEQEIFDANAEWKKYQLFLEPPPIQWIGYTSASPLVVGKHMYVVLGTAVVAKLSLSGDLIWAKRVGSPPSEMNGFQMGNAASPVLVDGVLIVGMTDLFGLDPKTGKTLWKKEQYKDFGTPAVMRLRGQSLIITPAGEVLLPKDGEVLAKGLGQIWFASPIVHKDVVYFVGSSGNEVNAEQKGGSGGTTKPGTVKAADSSYIDAPEKRATARAVRITRTSKNKVRWAVVWETDLATDNYFSSPATDGTRLYAVSHNCQVSALDLATGDLLFTQELKGRSFHDVYASPIVGRDKVYILESHGSTHVLEKGTKFQYTGINFVDGRFIGTAFIRNGQIAMRGIAQIILTAAP